MSKRTVRGNTFNHVLSTLEYGFTDVNWNKITGIFIIKKDRDISWSISGDTKSGYGFTLAEFAPLSYRIFTRLLKKEAIKTTDGKRYTFNERPRQTYRRNIRDYWRPENRPEPLKQDSKRRKLKRKLESRYYRNWQNKLSDEGLKYLIEFREMEERGLAKAVTGHPKRGKHTLRTKKLNKKYRRSVVKKEPLE